MWPAVAGLAAPPLDIKFEVQHLGLGCIAFLRGAIVEAFAGSAVEFASDGVAGVLGEVGHALAFGQILSE